MAPPAMKQCLPTVTLWEIFTWDRMTLPSATLLFDWMKVNGNIATPTSDTSAKREMTDEGWINVGIVPPLERIFSVNVFLIFMSPIVSMKFMPCSEGIAQISSKEPIIWYPWSSSPVLSSL